ncbi:tRNA CCA-pyrophosphorylase [Pollutimonas harenae]|uniref:tRNA CCA-pyrophosphorylase n=1 Tax=Pollutimonas harenae TaxID=657015 RepID=A0A853H110_9BURK|nr:tRNA CCA-pyrophosphorylase [Pollutimonas harenae]NYT84935.1 tRNA CCA-pyrophosphorylase [Pollutimonas harenae]TEA73629.1 tRNA CCA-pyrophosphorylase [Pollutimonas harenae]
MGARPDDTSAGSVHGGQDNDPATAGLDVYIVGGAVRDAMLGLPAGDRDWVVVGATPEQMSSRGFIPVGGDFPVFLHPQTKEEYALARTERKSGRGYKGFTFYTGTDVSLEDDLQRRDLTVNAIAQAPNGRLVDPLGGQKDLQQRVLRHVGQAFVEDPVRLLRLARFAARFDEFSIASETLELARKLVQEGEVDALVPERVWREVAKGLMVPRAGRMFQVLADTGALARVLPGLRWHEEPSSTELVCAAHTGQSLAVRFALVCRFSDDPQSVARHVKAPTECQDYARLLPGVLDQVDASEAPAWLALMERCDALRKPDRFLTLVRAAQCVKEVDLRAWQARVDAIHSIDAGAIAKAEQGRPGRIKAALYEARLTALRTASAEDGHL